MSEEYQIIYTPKALDDLESIFLYIARNLQEISIAEKQVNRIRESIRALSIMPDRHVRVNWEPWQSLEMRKMPVDHYLVFYRVEHTTKTVTIVRILYAGRDIPSIARDFSIENE